MRKFILVFFIAMLYASIAMAQSDLFTGRVIDEQNSVVPFATVRIKGGTKGVSADAQGNFTIEAKAGDKLLVSATGFTEKEVTIGTEKTLSIRLGFNSANLSEVVVTALGIKREKRMLTYTTQEVKH